MNPLVCWLLDVLLLTFANINICIVFRINYMDTEYLHQWNLLENKLVNLDQYISPKVLFLRTCEDFFYISHWVNLTVAKLMRLYNLVTLKSQKEIGFTLILSVGRFHRNYWTILFNLCVVSRWEEKIVVIHNRIQDAMRCEIDGWCERFEIN